MPTEEVKTPPTGHEKDLWDHEMIIGFQRRNKKTLLKNGINLGDFSPAFFIYFLCRKYCICLPICNDKL